ncbi:MAG: LapA family protein [Pseudoxanthomonas sp.]
MNIVRLVIALLILGYGLLIGVLNTDGITLHLLFAQISTTSGVGIILSLLLGVVVGALIVLALAVWPLYNKLRQASRQIAASGSPSSAGN